MKPSSIYFQQADIRVTNTRKMQKDTNRNETVFTTYRGGKKVRPFPQEGLKEMYLVASYP